MIRFGIYLIIFLIPFQLYFNFYKNLSISAAQLVALVLVFSTLIKFLKSDKRSRQTFGTLPLSYLILGFVAVMLASIAVSNNALEGLKYFAKWTSFILIYYVVIRNVQTKEEILRFINWGVVTATIVAVLGIVEHYLGYSRIYEILRTCPVVPVVFEPETFKEKLNTDSFNYVVHNWDDMTKSGIRAFGTFECAIEFSAYLGLLAPFAIRMAQKDVSRPNFPVFAPSFVLILVALILSFTRSAYLGALITLGLFIFIMQKMMLVRKRYFVVAIVGMLAISAGILLGSRQTTQTLQKRLFHQVPQEYTRSQLWTNALKIIRAQPVLGTGIANYRSGLKKYTAPDTPLFPAHNQYLQVAAETGLLGLFAYLGIILTLLKYCCTILTRSGDNNLRILALAFLGVWAWYCLQSFFDTYLFGDKFSMMFWLMVGLNASLYRIYLRERPKEQIPSL